MPSFQLPDSQLPDSQPVIHNQSLKSKIQSQYSLADIRELKKILVDAGTFDYKPLANGLFPAATTNAEEYEYTGYSNVWVRDNVHLVCGLLADQQTEAAVQCVRSLLDYFQKHVSRIDHIVDGTADAADPMNRPHIRFQGETLTENKETWSHAQNDALGGFVWIVTKLANERLVLLSSDEVLLLLKFVAYFEKIEYWKDEDSGHWEEVRKIAASSIGSVVAGLQGLLELEKNLATQPVAAKIISDHTASIQALLNHGETALKQILPAECIQSDPSQNRPCDAALLFLISPLQVVNQAMGEQIVDAVKNQLMGEHGIRRYRGDSYWCADYKTKLSAETRTADFSDDMTGRDALLKQDEEAQWCIFDSTLSVIYGRWACQEEDASTKQKWHEQQTFHFNRALGQLTSEASPFGSLKCPESYYLVEGKYVPNDITPLYWAQANLQQAFAQMEQQISLK